MCSPPGFKLTGWPAEWSEHSIVARLVLGRQFDAVDLLWYPVGVLPLVVLHGIVVRAGRPTAGAPTS